MSSTTTVILLRFSVCMYVLLNAGSSDFNSAISDMKLYFPDGIWADKTSAVIKDYKVGSLKKYCML